MAVMMLVCGFGQTQQPAARVVKEWVVNPYRMFLGSWTGQQVIGEKRATKPVTVTITEEKNLARMVWAFDFGVSGQKGFETARKYIVFSPRDGKMLMHYDGYPERLFDAPGLVEFTKSGVGEFTATETFEKRNYWHVQRPVINVVTFKVQADTLSYRWDVTEHGKTRFYSEVDLNRVPKASSTAASTQP